MSDWVRFHRELCEGEKANIPRATRFVYMELLLEARRGERFVRLPPGWPLLKAVANTLGGNRRELKRALDELGTSEPRMIAFEERQGVSRLHLLWRHTSKRWDDANRWPRLKMAPLVFERDGRVCRYCGATDRLTIDHVLPRRRGGSDDLSNLVVACRQCNSKKGVRTPSEAGMALR
jgi:5-methylcytosine-specific restriction endonuclease McrA